MDHKDIKAIPIEERKHATDSSPSGIFIKLKTKLTDGKYLGIDTTTGREIEWNEVVRSDELFFNKMEVLLIGRLAAWETDDGTIIIITNR